MQAVLVGAALFVFVRGWRRDFHVPFSFFSDGLFYLLQSKSTVDNGWWWFNPMVGAPFGLDHLSFPANSNVDQFVVWVVSRVVPDALTAINLSWMLMVVLSGWAAAWCARQLGLSATSSIVAGTLFALSPYALYRNIAHFGMVVYLVPFVCTVALQLASGRLPARGYLRGPGAVLLAGCALLGFNYVYYPFFGCFFLGIAILLVVLAEWRPAVVRAGALCLAVTVVCTGLNLAPSLYSWSRHGKPIVLEDKVPGHAELFGLKIRTLVSPAAPHRFPPFRWWSERESAAQYPIETENYNARLGVVGSIGFVSLLAFLLVPPVAGRFREGAVLLGASRLTTAGVLLATVGGFGSLFSLFVSPQIRAYARIFPFLDFFALVAVAVFLDALFKSPRLRTAVAAAVLAVGLLDQGGAAAGLNTGYPGIAAQLASLEPFVRQLEGRLPDRAMVLQLPFRTYLNFSTIARMEPYEHLKLYMVSSRLRWSFPALSNEQVMWQSDAAALEPGTLPYKLAHDGFSAIVIDRYGYVDQGAGVSAAIRTALPEGSLLAETERYLALDIRSLHGGEAERHLPQNRDRPTTVCDGQPAISVDLVNGTRWSLAAAGPVSVSRSGVLRIVGWAFDPHRQTALGGLDVVVDQQAYKSVYGIDRGDVATHFGNPAYSYSGFVFEIDGEKLEPGPHTVSLQAISARRDCFYRGPQLAIAVE